jgi:hypothetical protein
LKLAIKNTSDPMKATSSGSPSPSREFDFGTPLVLKLKSGHHLGELAQEGVNPEDVLEIKSGHTIGSQDLPVLDETVTKNKEAVDHYKNEDGSKQIPTYKSYKNITPELKPDMSEAEIRGLLKKFADDAGLTFEPMGANMEERANLITTLPSPEMGVDSRIEVYVFRKTTAAEQAAFKELNPDPAVPAPTMIRVQRANRNVFAAGQSTAATEVVDSGQELSASIKTSEPFLLDVGHNFKFTREGDYVVVASVLGRRSTISNQLEFKVQPYWTTNMRLAKLDAWINERRSMGPFDYERMVYLVDGDGGFRELVYSKRYINGKLAHHEFFRLGRVHPEHEKEVEITVVDENVLKVKFTDSQGRKAIAQIDFSGSSPITAVNLIQP